MDSMRLKKTKKQWFSFGISMAVVGFIWYGIAVWGMNYQDGIRDRRKENSFFVDGIVYQSHYKKGRTVSFYYKYKDKWYQGYQQDSDNKLLVGGCYSVELDSSNPSNAIIKAEYLIRCTRVLELKLDEKYATDKVAF